MKKDFCSLQTVQFLEHPIVDFSQKEPSDLDITACELDLPPSFIHKGIFLMDGYNHALIFKVLNLPMQDIPDFLEHQCSQVKDPVYWLDQLEILITINYGLLCSNEHIPMIHKLFVNIQLLRLEIRQRRNPLNDLFVPNEKEDTFNLQNVISKISDLTTSEEKKAYLISLRADILEKNAIHQLPSIIEFIDIEFEKIEKLEKLGSSTNISKIPSTKSEKFIINGSINVLVDVFFQFLNEYKPLGKPYLDYSASKIADFISNSFLCSDGEIIPVSTVLTILSPGKTDKRPSKDKRINLRPDDL